jgi:DNA-binding transcriptional regulator PaaX
MKRDFGKAFLLEIFKAGGVVSLSLISPNAIQLLKPFIKNDQFNKTRFQQTINRLKKNELIGIKQDGDLITLKLHNKGRDKALKYNIEKLEISKPSRWDGHWHIVIFDIPENHKVARNVLKFKLDELGFKQIQKSVYLHPYPCEDEVEMIRSVYGVRPFVKTFTVTALEDEDKFKRHFLLQD